jgi:hypothetical protein
LKTEFFAKIKKGFECYDKPCYGNIVTVTIKSNVTITMVKKCLKCGREFEARRATKKFCSDACKVTFNRRGIDMVAETVEPLPGMPKEPKEVDMYPKYTENKRLHDEAKEFLSTHTLEECKKAGVWIPCWKLNEGKNFK